MDAIQKYNIKLLKLFKYTISRCLCNGYVLNEVMKQNLEEENEKLMDVNGQTIRIYVKAFGVKTIRII
jgi:hypothetical protein